MSDIGIGPSQVLPPVTPYSPLGNPAGESHTNDNKSRTLPSVEAAVDSDRLRDEQRDRVAAVTERDRGGGNRRESEDQPSPSTDSQTENTAPAVAATAIPSSQSLRAFIQSHGSIEHYHVRADRALGQFRQAASAAVPGVLLDQET